MASTLLVDNILDLLVDPVSSAVSGNFTYIAYADNTAGTGFTTTFSPTKLYYSIITSTTEIPGLSSNNFTGKWLPVPGKDIARNHFTYIAFADKVDGTGFTTAYSDDKEYFAIKISTTAITSPVVGDFVGLWQPSNQHSLTANYDKFAQLHTDDCAWNTNGMAYGSMTPGAYHYKGTYDRIYFAVLDWYRNANLSARAGHTANVTYVGYYDLESKAFSALTGIPHVYNTSRDGHDMPTILVSDDGHILVAQEQLRSSTATDKEGTYTGLHNSPMDIWRSDNIEDISTFTKVATIGSFHAYPNLTLGPNDGEVFCFLRGLLTPHSYLYVSKSSDNGATWGTAYRVASCEDIAGTGLDWYFYPRIVLGKRENGLNIVGSLNEGSGGTSPDGTTCASRYKIDVYLHSDDGINWGNAQYQFGTAGSFSKDVTVAAVSPSELLASCTFKDVKTVAHRSADIQDAGSDENGVPYVFVREWERYALSESPDYSPKDNLVIADSLFRFNVATGLWVYADITGKFREDYEATAADATKNPVRGGRALINVYSNGVVDFVSHRTIVKDDFYKSSYTVIDNAAEALVGGLFKILTTEPNNFGDGVIAGDYYNHVPVSSNSYYPSGDYLPLINANNTLSPLEQELVFYRSLDNGVTWTEIREPLYIRGFNYATSIPIITGVNNAIQNGYVGVFFGLPKPIAGGSAYDHSELLFVWDKVRT